jgi:hypothetical protein
MIARDIADSQISREEFLFFMQDNLAASIKPEAAF